MLMEGHLAVDVRNYVSNFTVCRTKFGTFENICARTKLNLSDIIKLFKLIKSTDICHNAMDAMCVIDGSIFCNCISELNFFLSGISSRIFFQLVFISKKKRNNNNNILL